MRAIVTLQVLPTTQPRNSVKDRPSRLQPTAHCTRQVAPSFALLCILQPPARTQLDESTTSSAGSQLTAPHVPHPPHLTEDEGQSPPRPQSFPPLHTRLPGLELEPSTADHSS